jgi:hypothetical protein
VLGELDLQRHRIDAEDLLADDEHALAQGGRSPPTNIAHQQRSGNRPRGAATPHGAFAAVVHDDVIVSSASA